MKTIRTFNAYNNGDQSKVNIYFADGTEFHRTISARDAMRIGREGESVLAEIMEKYSEPQPKPEPIKLTPREQYEMDLVNPVTREMAAVVGWDKMKATLKEYYGLA